MAVTERRRARDTVSSTAGPTPASDWSWERTLPITPAERPRTDRGLRVFPLLTWWSAAMITLMFVVLVVIV